MSDAIFTSTHAALVFAHHYQPGTDKAGLVRLIEAANGKPVKRGCAGLGGLDGAGQVGMIKSRLQRLDSLLKASLTVRTAPAAVPCLCHAACCAGKKVNDDWANAVSVLVNGVRNAALPGTSKEHPYSLWRACVVRHFQPKAERCTLDVQARQLGVHRQTFSTYASKVAKWLENLERTGMTELDDMLRESGMVGELS